MQAATAIVATGLVAWSLWPSVEPQAVNRFEYALPADQVFRRVGRPVFALSPDGRRFVYNTAKGLYLRTMGELEARLISGTEEDLNGPFFSPDGQSVGYYAFAGSQLKRIAITGGAPVKIADVTNPFGASWGADGTILFGQRDGIMRVSAAGGTPELVIPAKEGEQVDSPQLLPDGDSVLFTVTTASGSTRWDEAQVVVQSLTSGARTVVVQGGSDARYVPTGHVVYALKESLFAVAFDPSSRSVSRSAVPVVQGVARAVDPAGARGPRTTRSPVTVRWCMSPVVFLGPSDSSGWTGRVGRRPWRAPSDRISNLGWRPTGPAWRSSSRATFGFGTTGAARSHV